MSAAKIPFRKTMEFDYGAPREVAPGVRRVVAGNPSAFTHYGTNTYVVGRGEVAVVDPGPAMAGHVDALLSALAGETVLRIVVTHTHVDHSPGAARLKEATGARGAGAKPRPLDGGTPVEAAQEDFEPDIELSDGDVVAGPGWTLEAVHTPGHMSNHFCFSMPENGALFSGDHVMGWNTTIVSPPDGSMREYLDSLRVCLRRDDALYLPGHGPPIPKPRPFVRAYLGHRLMREREILRCVGDGRATVPEMVADLYRHLPETMHGAAARSVLAHAEHLVETRRLERDGPATPEARFRLPDPAA